jgi:hypothetical protein
MRLAWVEQGVRLENGKLDAKLEEGVRSTSSVHQNAARVLTTARWGDH